MAHVGQQGAQDGHVSAAGHGHRVDPGAAWGAAAVGALGAVAAGAGEIVLGVGGEELEALQQIGLAVNGEHPFNINKPRPAHKSLPPNKDANKDAEMG